MSRAICPRTWSAFRSPWPGPARRRYPTPRKSGSGVQRRFCDDLSQRAYLAAGDRDRGVPLDRALEDVELRTRPQFCADAAAVILMMDYDAPRRAPQRVARDVLAQCMRAGEVEVR